jgi:penicillin amidase
MWHFSHTSYPNGEYIAGGSIAGGGGYPFFSTDKVAIGITSIYTDNSDIYEEKIKGNMYEKDGKYYPLQEREEIIKVRGQEDVKYVVRSTHHGPLINFNAYELR